MAKKKTFYEIAVPWPEGILISLGGGMVVSAKTLAELRAKGEKVRIIRTIQR